jgi:hypothetical protein
MAETLFTCMCFSSKRLARWRLMCKKLRSNNPHPRRYKFSLPSPMLSPPSGEVSLFYAHTYTHMGNQYSMYSFEVCIYAWQRNMKEKLRSIGISFTNGIKIE